MNPEENIQRYVNEFSNKNVESGNLIEKLFKIKLVVRFWALREEHSLLRFLNFNKRYDPELIKAFYCNLKISDEGLECHFKNKLIKFSLSDFNTHFGLWARGDEICTTNAPKFSKLEFVTSIFKFVFGDRLDMANFNIIQIKFEMRILHWIMVKML